MLKLEEESWKNYEHAYGVATDIPALLKQLCDFPDIGDYQTEPYYSLWSSLCHQGDVYSASYAVLPHIVSIIESNPGKANYNFFLLPICIEIARCKGNGPILEGKGKEEYLNSLARLLQLVPKIENPDLTFTSVLSATVAACNGQAAMAEVMLELTEDVIKDFWEWFYER